MVPEHSPPRANPARGLALIATAVVIGFWVLRVGWGDGVSVSAGPEPDASEEAGEASTDGSATTAAPPPTHPASEVTVRVFNATNTGGAAAGLTTALENEGWPTVEATDAPEGWQDQVTEVYFIPGYDREAGSVANAVGAAAENVKPLPEGPPMDPMGAQVLVVLGADLAASFVD